MTRARWFQVATPYSPRALAARMKTRAFTEETTNGFLIERTRDDYTEGRYIEKLTYQETIPDPFGRETRYERTTYRQVPFTFHTTFPQLEIRDTPRNTHAFLSTLLELTNFTIATNALSVDILQWAKNLQEHTATPITVNCLQLSDVTVATGVLGTIALKSDYDVRDQLANITAGKTFRVGRARLQWSPPSGRVVAHLLSTGAVKLEHATPDTLALLRRTIPPT